MVRAIQKDQGYLDLKSPRENGWGRVVKTIDMLTDKVGLALQLEPCGVGDQRRLCYLNGEWYRAA